MIVLTGTDEVERWSTSLADAVIICDDDAAKAADATRSIDLRTAIFVGDIARDLDRKFALEFACETFDVDAGDVIIALPA